MRMAELKSNPEPSLTRFTSCNCQKGASKADQTVPVWSIPQDVRF